MQTIVSIALVSNQSRYAAQVRFFDDRLWYYALEVKSGSFEDKIVDLNTALSTMEKAVDGYRLGLCSDRCDEFSQMLIQSMHTGNLTQESDNALLRTIYGGNTSTPSKYSQTDWFRKIDHSVSHFASMHIAVSKNGLITRFIDNMAIYTVAAVGSCVSQEKAVDIALPYIQQYGSDNQQQITSLNATLEHAVDNYGDRGDPYTLHPQWIVTAQYDHTNNEGVFGYAVLIWADNGVVHHLDPQGSYNPYASQSSLDTSLVVGATMVTVVVLLVLSIHRQYRRKKR